MNNLNYNDVKERCDIIISKMGVTSDFQIISMIKLSIMIYINLSENFGDINKDENIELISHYSKILKRMEKGVTSNSIEDNNFIYGYIVGVIVGLSLTGFIIFQAIKVGIL